MQFTHKFTENFYGTVPRMDDSKAFEVMVRKDTPAKLGGVNYTSDETLWNYYPLMAEWQGRVIDASTGQYEIQIGTIKQMVESFQRGDQTGEAGQPIGVDYEHKTYTEGGGKFIGYVLDVREYTGEIATYTAQDVRIVKENPENTSYLMAKIAWLADGYELVKSGSLPYPSVVFTEDNNFVTMGIPTITGNPADKAVPAIVACKAKIIELEETNVNRDQLMTALMEYINTLDDTALQALYDQLLNSAPTEEATPEAKDNADVLDMLKQIMDKLSTTAAKAEDEGEIAARAELIKNGVLPDVASKLSANFKGINKDESIVCAKSYIEKNPPVKLGSHINNALPEPETYEGLIKKFKGEGMDILKASQKARETLKGDN